MDQRRASTLARTWGAYGGGRLAASTDETRSLCARPQKYAEQHVLAMATAVPVGNVLGGLRADMKKESAVFDFTLHVPAGSYGGESAYVWVSDRKGVRVCEGTVMFESPDTPFLRREGLASRGG